MRVYSGWYGQADRTQSWLHPGHSVGWLPGQVAPGPGAAGVEGGLGIQAGAHRLVEVAQAPDNLCRMDATWHPWY